MYFTFTSSLYSSPTYSSPSSNMENTSLATSVTDPLLDIHPRSSSSSSSSRSNSCAFPSWPYRSSLLAAAADEASSYLSDEDLFPLSDAEPSERPETPCSELTTEEQIEMFRQMAEREQQPEIWQPKRWCNKQKEMRLTAVTEERQRKRRSSSGNKKRTTSKTLKPISERG